MSENRKWARNVARVDVDSGRIKILNGEVGTPEATEFCTRERLEALGTVGVYGTPNDPEFKIIDTRFRKALAHALN